jgi:hypothetical protein
MRVSAFEEIKQWSCAPPAAVARRLAESISEVKDLFPAKTGPGDASGLQPTNAGGTKSVDTRSQGGRAECQVEAGSYSTIFAV